LHTNFKENDGERILQQTQASNKNENSVDMIKRIISNAFWIFFNDLLQNFLVKLAQ